MPNNPFEPDILKIKTDMESLANKQINPILQAYKRSLNRVQSDISKIYMNYTVNNELKISQRQRYTVLKQLEKQLILQAKELGNIDLNTTTKILSDVYEESFYKSAYVMENILESSINFSILRPEFIKAAVEMPIESQMFSDRIWKNKEKLVNRVRQDVERAMIEGKSVEKLARQIKNQFGVSGMESLRLLRTETARCHTQASLDIYNSSDVVKKVMWCATLDLKTNPIDASYDGKVWDINDSSKPSIPLHPNCRCCWLPVVSGYSPKKRLDNESKTIVDYKNYTDWKQSKGI